MPSGRRRARLFFQGVPRSLHWTLRPPPAVSFHELAAHSAERELAMSSWRARGLSWVVAFAAFAFGEMNKERQKVSAAKGQIAKEQQSSSAASVSGTDAQQLECTRAWGYCFKEERGCEGGALVDK